MPEYEHLTTDELLHLAGEQDQLTDDARVALEVELGQRKLSPADVEQYSQEEKAFYESEDLRRAAPKQIYSGRLGKKFLGKTNRRRVDNGESEEYESTLWFVVFWFPVFPIATYTVRRNHEHWLGMGYWSDETPTERHARNWNQILLTWVKASSVVLAIRILFLLVLHHPQWLAHFP